MSCCKNGVKWECVKEFVSLLFLFSLHLAQDAGSRGSPGFDAGTANAICVNEELWRREGVTVECLSRWNKNFRQASREAYVYNIHFFNTIE